VVKLGKGRKKRNRRRVRRPESARKEGRKDEMILVAYTQIPDLA